MFKKKDMNMKKWLLPAFALGSIFMAACSDGDKTAGTSEESEGIVAVTDWEVAGVSQKGPFVTGSAVTVQELDGITLKQTGKSFKGTIKSDKGDFAIKDINLESQYAILEASGYYRDEISGKKSVAPVTLRALTDLSNRKTVNINLLTHLEYERVMYLVTEKKKSIAAAKAQADEEILAAFGIEGDFGKSEDLNIFESGDGNAALLAISVLMQADADVAGLTERMGEFSIAIAEGGDWEDADTKAVIADWACDADLKGTLANVRKNVEDWKYADTVPAFEKYVTNFWWDNYGLGQCTEKREGDTKRNVNKLSKMYNEYFVCESGRWVIPGEEHESSSSKGGSSSSKKDDVSSSSEKDTSVSSSSEASSSSVTNPFISSSSPVKHDTIPELTGDLAFLESFFDEYESYVTFENEKQKNWVVSTMKYESLRVRDSALVAFGDALIAQGFGYAGRTLIDDALCLQEGDSAYAYVKNVGGLVYKIYVKRKTQFYTTLLGAYYGYDLKIVALENGMEERLSVNCKSLKYEKELPEEVRFIGDFGNYSNKQGWNDDSLMTFWFVDGYTPDSWRDTSTCRAEGRSEIETRLDSIKRALVEKGFTLVKDDVVEVSSRYYSHSSILVQDGRIQVSFYEMETEKALYKLEVYSGVSEGGDVFARHYSYMFFVDIYTFYKRIPE